MPRSSRRGLVLRRRDRSAAGLRKKKQIPKPTRLGDAVRLVAQLGGYIGRAKDPSPGHQIMWHGYSVLQSLREGLSLRHWTSDDNKTCG
ncbi:IS4 family transposase [Accumulibacter sp.]|uniref:IS4 family transposase n=1 Tax=Accumulibacter sp. TaxID=2053492 RepID=UPI003DA900B2